MIHKNPLEAIKMDYSENPEKEWLRMIKDPFHELEFNTTMHFLKKYLPKKGLILDAGGGPGRYTIEFAKMGYEVVLLDFTPKNLELAKEKIKKAKVENKLKGILEGNISDLSCFKDNSFDAVVCIGGPISHVPNQKDREKAAKELVRVAKKKAPIFVAGFGKFSVLMNAPAKYPDEIKMTKHFKELVVDGDDFMWHGGRSYAHFFTLAEFKGLFDKKVEFLENVGLEGLGSSSEEAINLIYKNKKVWKNWLESHYKLCTNPIVADCSQHMLLVMRKI